MEGVFDSIYCGRGSWHTYMLLCYYKDTYFRKSAIPDSSEARSSVSVSVIGPGIGLCIRETPVYVIRRNTSLKGQQSFQYLFDSLPFSYFNIKY